MRLQKNLGTSFAAVLAAFLVSCGGSATPASTPREPSTTATDDPSCPVTVPGTSVTVEDTSTGAALVFVTTGDVSELRRRVTAMATMHNDHHGKMGPLPTGEEAGGGGHAGHDMAGMDHSNMNHAAGGEHDGHAGGMISIHSKAAEEDIEGGAKLVVTAAPSDIAALGDQLRMHAKHLAAGTCKMDGAASGHTPDGGGHDGHAGGGHSAVPVEPAAPDPAKVKAELLATETSAYQAAKPVFEKYCASCHQQGGKKATAKKLGHFDITSYPFAGHHAMEVGATVRKVLGIGGGKPTMPMGKPGIVKGDELALIAAWADAFDASHTGGAHEGMEGDEHKH